MSGKVLVGLNVVLAVYHSATAQMNQLMALPAATSVKAINYSFGSAKMDRAAVHFCGEVIPANHPAIMDRWVRTLDRQANLAADLTVMKRRASVVFPLIEPILQQYNIPADFKFLPLLESAVNNRAVSPKGAAGFWQLMPQTAQALGLRVSYRYDERFNLLKATHAACRYIRELHDQLGSWMLVATAYNAGPNYVQHLTRQYPDQHPMALPYRAAETRAYLFQTLAIKELITRPQAYRDRLNSHHLAALSDDSNLTEYERQSILSSFDLSERDYRGAAVGQAMAKRNRFNIDSETTVVLLTETDTEFDVVASEAEPTLTAETFPTSPRLVTRSLSEGPLKEGKLCVFQVTQTVRLNGRTFAAGDIIQAHVEHVDAQSGRVFLRTNRLLMAQTQEAVPLTLVATDQPKQPGVAIPARLHGWQLTWEAM